MSDRSVLPRTPISSVDELVARFGVGSKPRAAWRIGVEHEKIGVVTHQAALGAPAPYEGPAGVETLLRLLAGAGWVASTEDGRVVGLSRGPERISLEPGGQLELSADPLLTLAEVQQELRNHLADIAGPSAELGLAWLGLGFRPFGTLDDVPWVPKGRYAVMRDVLPRVGRLAHEMMKRTATVQVNLDYSDEEDAERKLRTAMSITSLITALFANSPLVDGRDAGYASYRARVWLETDPARCGLLPFVFERGDLFRRYTEWALDVPMLFLYRGQFRPVSELTFRRFLREGYQGERATLEDWDLHLSSLFPEARLKHYLELRGADAGPLSLTLALPALWLGLLYDDDACGVAANVPGPMSLAEREALRAAVPRQGLAARLPDGRSVLDAARELVNIARDGLRRVSPAHVGLLEPIDELVATGRGPYERTRAAWKDARGDRARFIRAVRLI